MRRTLLILLAALVALASFAAHAQARVYIDVNKPFSRKLPLAMPVFQPASGAAAAPQGDAATSQLGENLAFTGLFEILDPKTFLGDPTPGNVNYAKWTKVGAELLIVGNYRVNGDNLSMECRLYDVTEGRLLVGRRYDGAKNQLASMVYRFADEVMRAVTGQASIFSSQIAFVGQRAAEGGAVKELYLMRFDGSGVRQLTNSHGLTMYPAFSPDGRLLAYTSYRNRRPLIFVMAMAGGSGQAIIKKPGVNITPMFLPNGRELAMAMSFSGRTKIYKSELAGGKLTQLTDGWGIDVRPAFSPDGRFMAFTSDRGGSPQIYVKDLASGQARRLTYGRRYCADPSWSPRGGLLACQCEIDGVFQIVTIRADGTGPRVLTSGSGGGEQPVFSPDGRLIAYTGRHNGRYQIFVMTVGGQPIKRLTNLPGNNTNPAWSPQGMKLN